MDKPRPDLSISIIDTNNRELTLQCLRSVFDSTSQISIEVFVVDNASDDGSSEAIVAEFPQVTLIRNENKLGFSTNNNLALERACGRYLMILNDDTIVQPGAFDALVAFMDAHPDAGACGPRLLNPDGSEQQSFAYSLGPLGEAFRPLTLLGRRSLHRSGEEVIEVDRVIGACMIVRREVTEQVGLLDPAFDPIYAEETDWCYRIKKQGWKIYLVPDARVVHLGGQTMKRVRTTALQGLYRKKILFFRKHHGWFGASAYRAGLWLSSAIKLLVWSILLVVPGQRVQAKSMVWEHWHICRTALSS